MKGQCPAHRAGLNVTVTERGLPTLRCNREVWCSLQAGHGGECEGADND